MATTLPIELIVSDPAIHSGWPIIAGTAVTVAEIAAAVNFNGATTDALAEQFDLTLAEVYAALAYYHTHRTAIDQQIREQRDQAEALRDLAARRAWINRLKPQIATFCQRWGIVEFALFGSVLGQDFRLDSDIDVLVTFGPEAHITLFDLTDMERELKGIFGRPVELADRASVEQSPRPRRRRGILSSAEVIHVA